MNHAYSLAFLVLLALGAACSDEDPAGGGDGDDLVEEDEPSTGEDDDPSSGTLDGGTSGGSLDAGRHDTGVSSDGGRSDSDGGSTQADGGAGSTSDAASPLDAGKPGADGGLRPKCMQKDSQLIVIDDSYINWPATHTFPEDMAAVSGQEWRMEAIGGASMASAGTGLIPDQFDQSIALDPDAHSILMDGGGNDLLIGDFFGECKNTQGPTIPFCQELVRNALDAAEALMTRAAAAGIRDVVYFFYPRVPDNTILGGETSNAMLEYALPMVRDFCASVADQTSGKLRCHFIDMVPVFEGKPQDEWFFPGDIHPTSVGSKAMADTVWAKMKEVCVGQKPESGCCEP